MPIPLLFIQGGSEGAYDADAELATSLRQALGRAYDVRYPRMPNEDDPDVSAWSDLILAELEAMGPNAILVGHSIGASVIIKMLTEHAPRIAAVFLIAAPFWYDHDFWKWKEAQLPKDAAARVPGRLPITFYHGTRDESVPFSHLAMYARLIPQAVIRPLEGRGHQLENDPSEVARDIKALCLTGPPT